MTTNPFEVEPSAPRNVEVPAPAGYSARPATPSLLEEILRDGAVGSEPGVPRGGGLDTFLSEVSTARALALWFGPRRFASVDQLARAISVSIGLIGMIFVGITVAIATRALTDVAGQASRRDSKDA